MEMPERLDEFNLEAQHRDKNYGRGSIPAGNTLGEDPSHRHPHVG
jgi:hypothetical protein